MSGIGASRSDATPDKIEMARYLKESLETASRLTLFEVPEDVVIFIGTTKSGKSTLLNSLLGNKLVGVKEPKLRSIYIEKEDNSLGPEIGRGPTSETVYPTRWVSSEKLGGLVLWDSPGFDDNRGPIQDIINAFYVYRLFNNINSAKIVLVTDVNDILHDRINPFLSLLTSVENLFKDQLAHCFSNIVVAFTKVPATLDDEPVNKNFISDVLVHQILSSDSINMSQLARRFIKHLTKNHQQIGLFKKAKIGPISSKADDEIIQAIRSINGVQHEILKTVSPSIAPTAKIFLYEVRHELTSNNSFIELETTIKEAFKCKLNDYQTDINDEESCENLFEIKERLISFENTVQTIINDNISFHSKIENIEKIDPKFTNKIQANDLIEKSKIMEFIDGVLGLKESQVFNVNLRSIMEFTKSSIKEIIIMIHLRMHNISQKEADAEIKKIRQEIIENEKRAEEERKAAEEKNEEVAKGLFTTIGRTIDNALEYTFGWFRG